MTTKENPARLTDLSSEQEHSSIFGAKWFEGLSDSAYVRLSQLIQSPARPKCYALIPFSAATLWRNVAAGTFPEPVKLSARVTAWQVGAIRGWLAKKAGSSKVEIGG